MPSESAALATLRPELAGSFMEYELAMLTQGFIAAEVLPTIEVQKQTGIFGKIPIEQLLKNRTTLRAPGAGYSRSGFTFTSDSFICDENGAEEVVDDRQAAQYADFFTAELISAARARNDVLLNAEKRAAALIFNATTWTSDTTAVTNEWDDTVNATPRKDVKTAMLAVWAKSGLWPNAMIINHIVLEHLKDSQEILNRSKSAGFDDPSAGAITEATIANALGIGRLIVAGSPKNTAIEGQTISISPVWDDEYAMICRVATSQDIQEPCIGRTFHWGEDGSSIGGTVESYREEKIRSDVIRVRHDVDEKVLYVEAGHLLSNITS